MSDQSTAVERYEQPRGGAVALTDRDMKSIGFQSQAIAFLDPRLKDMKPDEKKQAALGLAITLYNYRLPITVTNAKKLHLIQGEPVESGQLLVGLLEMAGHEIRPVVTSDERCTLRGWRHGTGEPYEVTYTIEQARTSGALDEWVENWQQTQSGKRFMAGKFVVSVDGVPTTDEVPDWAAKAIAAGKVKRKDAWFLYRSDMLAARCIRRLAKWMGADALLGAGSPVDSGYVTDEDERLDPPLRTGGPDEDQDDDDVVDAELVDEPTAGSPTTSDAGAEGEPPAPTASNQWVSAFLASCQDLALEGVRPGALAAAIVRHVTAGERSEPQTLRRGAEQNLAKATFAEVADGRWDIAVIDGVATLVEAGSTPEEAG